MGGSVRADGESAVKKAPTGAFFNGLLCGQGICAWICARLQIGSLSHDLGKGTWFRAFVCKPGTGIYIANGSRKAVGMASAQDICRDIKKLDYAKQHLTHTITAFRRLSMLVTAVGADPGFIPNSYPNPISNPNPDRNPHRNRCRLLGAAYPSLVFLFSSLGCQTVSACYPAIFTSAEVGKAG